MADPTAVQGALDEVLLALAALVPVLEGARDYQRLNLKPPASNAIDAAIADYEARTAALLQAKSALEALLANGYPAMPVREIPPDAYNDLNDNRVTIEAALAQFAPRELAADLGLAASAPEPK